MPNGNAKKQPSKSVSSAQKAAKTAQKAAKAAGKAEKAANRAITREHGNKTASSINKAVESVALEHEVERAKAVELAKKLCCPNMYPSYGVQDGYSSFPTASSTPYMVEPACPSSTAVPNVDALGVPVEEQWGFAHRDPRCSLRFYDATNRTFDYIGVTDSGTRTNDWVANDETVVDYFIWNTGFEAHGPILYAGVPKSGQGSGTRFFPSSVEQYINMNGLPATTATKCSVDILRGDEVITYVRTQTTDGSGAVSYHLKDFVQENDSTRSMTVDFQIVMVGNIRFDQAVTAGELHLVNTAKPCLRQLCLADWEDVEDVIEKVRFPALNLMYSNTAPPLSRNGYAAAWQVPSNIDPLWIMTQGFQYLANRPGADRIEATDGIHIFWKSTDPLDWEYLEVGDSDGGTSPSSYTIDSDSDYLAICLTIPIADGRAGYWTVFSDVQYRHNSVWHPMSFPDHNRRTFEYALEIQSRVPQVHSNPFHIKDIFKWIGQHKGQINSTIDLANQASGNRLGQFASPAKSFLDIWFK